MVSPRALACILQASNESAGELDTPSKCFSKKEALRDPRTGKIRDSRGAYGFLGRIPERDYRKKFPLSIRIRMIRAV